jgi:hypothetical protein
MEEKLSISINKQGLELKNLQDMQQYAEIVIKARAYQFKTPEEVVIALQTGYELGLTINQSCESIAVINGKATIYGDAMKGIVYASGLCEYVKEHFEGEPYKDDFKAVCISKRINNDEHRYEFSVADAKLAELWDNPNKLTWKKHPKRMLMFRARGFNLRDSYPDVLKGFKPFEEVTDYEEIKTNKTTSNKKGINGLISGLDIPE